jgi:hypothetical protein
VTAKKLWDKCENGAANKNNADQQLDGHGVVC